MLRRSCWRSRSSSGRAATPSRWATGSRGSCRTCSRASAGAAWSLVASRRVFALHGRARASARCAPSARVHVALVPDGERFKSRATLDAPLRRLPRGPPRPRRPRGGARRRRRRRRRRLRRRHLDARRRLGGHPDDAAVDGRQLDRRQGRDQPREGQEPDRGLPPAARGGDRPVVPRRRSPVRELRSGRLRDPQVRDPRRPAPCSRRCARRPPGLRGWDRVAVENAIATACRIKAEVVEKDEREGGLRRVLNLGHTIGHALEAVTGYRRFTHGEAVGWGLVGAACDRAPARACSRRRASTRSPRRSTTSGRGRGSPTSTRRRSSRRSPATRRRRAGRVPFVLPTRDRPGAIHDDVDARRDRRGRCG